MEQLHQEFENFSVEGSLVVTSAECVSFLPVRALCAKIGVEAPVFCIYSVSKCHCILKYSFLNSCEPYFARKYKFSV